MLEDGAAARGDGPAPRARARRALSVEVVDFLLDPLRSGIELRALLEVVLAGGFCGALGFWVVSERLAYGAESLSHGLLPGPRARRRSPARRCCSARPAGRSWPPALIALAARDARIGPDTGTAVAVTGLVGLGALLALVAGRAAAARGAAVRRPARRDRRATSPRPRPARRAAAPRSPRSTARSRARLRPRRRGRARPAPRAASGSRCSRCSRPRSPSRCRASARCSCWPCSWPRRSRSAATCARPARAMLAGAAVAVLAGVVGIQRLGPRRHSAAGASVALVLCARRGGSGAVRSGGGRRGGAPRRAATSAAPSASIARLTSWASVSPATTASLRRMNSTRKRSTPGEHQVEPEQHAGREAVAQAPQHQRRRGPSRASRRSGVGCTSSVVGTVPSG